MANQPEFFIDRSLGRHIVPDAPRACGLAVITMADFYGERVGQQLSPMRRGCATQDGMAGSC